MPIISFLLLFILFSAENSRASDPEGKFDAGVLFNVAPPPDPQVLLLFWQEDKNTDCNHKFE